MTYVTPSGDAIARFAAEVQRTAPANYPLFLSVRGWLVQMYERGWADAKLDKFRVHEADRVG